MDLTLKSNMESQFLKKKLFLTLYQGSQCFISVKCYMFRKNRNNLKVWISANIAIIVNFVI